MSALTPEEIARLRSKYGWEVWPLADMAVAQAARIAQLEGFGMQVAALTRERDEARERVAELEVALGYYSDEAQQEAIDAYRNLQARIVELEAALNEERALTRKIRAPLTVHRNPQCAQEPPKETP